MRNIVSTATLSGFLLLVAAPSSIASSEPEIRIAELNWAASSVISHVLKDVIEDYLGGTATVVFGDEIALMEAVAKGDGGMDVFSDYWRLTFPAPWAKYMGEGSDKSVAYNDKPYVGEEGLFVPGYVAERYGITDIEQMKDPEIAKLFDTDGNGKGEYWTGPIGWQSVDTNDIKARSMGYDHLWESVNVEISVFEMMLREAYRKEEPILFYSYTPEWIHAAYDLRKLSEPPYAEDCYQFVQQSEDPEGFANSRITCGTESGLVYVAYSATLAERAPKTARFLKQFAVDTSTVAGWIRQVSDSGMTAEEVSAEWVAANGEIIENEWLAGIDRE